MKVKQINLKYNYVIFGNQSDFMRIAYSDLSKLDCVKYIDNFTDKSDRFINFLYRLHTAPRINNCFHLPFKEIWRSCLFSNEFCDDKPICFFFMGYDYRRMECGLIEYLRQNFRGCKIVSFSQDLVCTCNTDFKKLNQKFDLSLSFDQKDAVRYGMLYYPLVYSYYDTEDNVDIKSSDVYFVGKAKDRLTKIIDAYDRLQDLGLKCDFHVVGVEPSKRIYKDAIDYCQQMPYIENLKRIKATKSLLEIMQGGGCGYTLRYSEAIMYDKKLITDNSEITKAPFYSPERILAFKSPAEIDATFVLNEPLKVDYRYKDKLSPIKLLEFIDSQL